MWELQLNREQAVRNMHMSFFGCWSQQRPEAFSAINDLLNFWDFTNIIEIGTFDGGFSTMMSLYVRNSNMPKVKEDSMVSYKDEHHSRKPKNFHTFDIKVHDEEQIKLIESLGGNFYQDDCFEKEDFIKDLIQQEGRSIVFCDGGDKPKEISTFAKHLKPNDVIMGHDFYYDEISEKYRHQKVWHSKELSINQIRETIEKENIFPVFRETFDPVVWFCGVKVGEDTFV